MKRCIKDGEQEQVSDTFDVSSSKAKSITKSEEILDEMIEANKEYWLELK